MGKKHEKVVSMQIHSWSSGVSTSFMHALPPFVNRMDFMPNFSQLSYHKQVSHLLVIMWNSTS